MSDLKPCPFCGGKDAVLQDRGVMDGQLMLKFAWCQRCGARTNAGDEATAIAAWNRRASQWVSVEERLPEEPGVYLVVGLQHSNGEPYVATDVLHEKEGCWFFAYQSVTHWMPLPEPPEVP